MDEYRLSPERRQRCRARIDSEELNEQGEKIGGVPDDAERTGFASLKCRAQVQLIDLAQQSD